MSQNQQQTISKFIGFLFLLPLLSYGIGDALLTGPLSQGDTLAHQSASQPSMIIGALLMLINSLTVVLLGIMLFPILHRYHPLTARSYLSSRLLEAVLLLIGLVALLSLLSLSQTLSADELAEASILKTWALAAHRYAYQLAMIVLGVGSLSFCLILFRTKLIPAFLAIWGLIGYVLLAAGAVAELFGYPIGIALSLPGGVFELTFGIWLMVKGFSFPSDSE
ncbi:MAG: DUF4386 domain-containing protein [Bacteroidota bacterium]